jgi:uncharacterized protein (TIGR04551 family)
MRRLALFAVMSLSAGPAFAQFGPGGGAPGGGAPAANPEKEEGPAEQAPETKGEGPALQPLPAWPQQKEKQLQFFELHGYIRFRAYLFHQLNMGFWNPSNGGPTPPFFIPYSEQGSSGNPANTRGTNDPSCAARDKSACRTDNLTSADMRLRLEPTINVTEQVRVKAQADIFDNYVMGTTPEGYFLNNRTTTTDVLPGLAAASKTQTAPQPGLNSVYDSIRFKRAWAEVRTPFGELRFGRMPSHWGMGMYVNNGDCLDCDFGATADRVMFSTKLWGHYFAFLWDWVATGPTTQIIGPQQNQGAFFNADTLDDVSQWILAVFKQDNPTELKEKLDQGKIVFNYGLYAIYRQQDWSQSVNPTNATNNDPTAFRDALVPRQAKAGVVDVWLRLNWKKLHIEAEGAIVAGSIQHLQDVFGASINKPVNILSGGFVVKADYKLLHDALKLFLEIGYASGDDSEDPNAVLNYRFANLVPVNNAIHRFAFDPDYHVDLILFRRILGTVNNATYFKPGASYDIVDNFGARVDLMYALANNPIGYPGNSYNLGLEIDAALTYKNEEEGFYASLVYGVLFPFGALSTPGSIYGAAFNHDPDTAQTFQARIAVKF